MGKALLSRGTEGAKEFLSHIEVLERDCPQAIDDHVRAIQCNALEMSKNTKQASDLRMERINAGSRDAIFYTDEAKARLDAGDAAGALDILDKAKRNGCADEYTEAIRASVLRPATAFGRT